MGVRTDLVFPLDVGSAEEAAVWVDLFEGLPVVFKVGLQLFVSAGPEFVRALTAKGHRVFLDLKLHDIPNTVAEAVRSAEGLGVEWLTLHALGGPVMLRTARTAVTGSMKLLSVSVLTSTSQQQWSELSQASTETDGGDVSAAALRLVDASVAWGAHGVVCSPLEIESIRKKHSDLLIVTPGIRPAGSVADDQSRIATPRQAAEWGASAIVVGRPIRLAKDPKAVAKSILSELV